MTIDKTNPKPFPAWAHKFALATAILYLVSLVFPIAASLMNTAMFPQWVGGVDVALAILLALMALVILGLAQGKVTRSMQDITYRAYRILLHVILLLLVAFFLFGDRIVWTIGLTGIAWRAWLLLYCLPYWFTVIQYPTVPATPIDP